MCEMVVPQLASWVRVLPQRKLVASQALNPQVWVTSSEAIQMELPSLAAAP